MTMTNAVVLIEAERDAMSTLGGALADIEGVAAKVVELTGEPGDMVFCHPTLVHCVSPNCGNEPRFMRIRQHVMSDEGRKLMSRAMHPR